MGGFTRRFSSNPGTDVLRQIEGTAIIDLPPPGSITGTPTGTVCMVGEYVDMSLAVQVSAGGLVTTNPTARQVYGPADLLDAGGGFDEYLGKFGAEGGNAFVELRNKSFSALVIAPVDLVTPLAGIQGTLRLWRELPTNTSATDATPFTPVSAAVVLAGREFFNSTHRIRLAQKVLFTDFIAYASGVDGAVTNASGAAATQSFTAAGGAFTTVVRNDAPRTVGVQEGDILVIGVLGASGAQGANAATYRVVSVTSATALSVELLAGTSFDWTTGTAIAWRLHLAGVGDSAGESHHQLSEAAGYQVIARPLDATVAAGTAIGPTLVPAAPSATAWDPLSGLAGLVHPTQAMTYDANVHAVNPANTTLIGARYTAALNALLSDDEPARSVNIVVCARAYSVISASATTHVLAASARGLTRRYIESPTLTVLTMAAATGDSDPGVGARRNERHDYSWPNARTLVPEAVGFTLATSDGRTTTDGILDVSGAGWLAAVQSKLAPERNPGQALPPVPETLTLILAFARGTPRLGMAEYITLKAKGICALRNDRKEGWQFQSGVTTSLLAGEDAISRRRMADYIQDSAAERANAVSKLPPLRMYQDTFTGQLADFLTDLLSEDNPPAQRIAGYGIDDKSGNTAATRKAGLFVVIFQVNLLGDMGTIVLQSQIGVGVALTTQITKGVSG